MLSLSAEPLQVSSDSGLARFRLAQIQGLIRRRTAQGNAGSDAGLIRHRPNQIQAWPDSGLVGFRPGQAQARSDSGVIRATPDQTEIWAGDSERPAQIHISFGPSQTWAGSGLSRFGLGPSQIWADSDVARFRTCQIQV